MKALSLSLAISLAAAASISAASATWSQGTVSSYYVAYDCSQQANSSTAASALRSWLVISLSNGTNFSIRSDDALYPTVLSTTEFAYRQGKQLALYMIPQNSLGRYAAYPYNYYNNNPFITNSESILSGSSCQSGGHFYIGGVSSK